LFLYWINALDKQLEQDMSLEDYINLHLQLPMSHMHLQLSHMNALGTQV